MMGAKGLIGYMFLYAKGTKCLVMALCLGPGGPKVFLDTCSRMRKVQMVSHGPMSGTKGAMAPWPPLDPLQQMVILAATRAHSYPPFSTAKIHSNFHLAHISLHSLRKHRRF